MSKPKQNTYLPQTVSHPGDTLAEKLDEMSMSQKEFAVRTGKPEQTIIKVLSGNSSITPDMAVKFESVLMIPAKFWLNRQRDYDESVARQKRKETIEVASVWAREFPYSKMALLGWIPQTRKVHEKVEHLFRFFGISSHQAWEDYYLKQKLKLNFRISLASTSHKYALSAWLRHGELQGAEIEARPYDVRKIKENLSAIKSIMAEHPTDLFEQLRKMCSDAGVKVVYTPCLPGAPIHGSTRWLNETPLIQLSARYKRNDIFWFTFFHEVGHIINHGKKYISLENIAYQEIDVEKEAEADAFAVRWTFSEGQEAEVLSHSNLSEKDIIQYSKKFNTHPAVIIGRLQHKGLLAPNVGRHFMEPINLGA